MEYPMKFSRATWVTRVEGNKVIGDYEAKVDQPYRVIKESTAHESSPGVEFALIALPGNGLPNEWLCIVPQAALGERQGAETRQ